MTRPFTLVCHPARVNGANRRLGSAQVRWNDYVGTAAADDANAVLDSRSLYEIADLDRERWTVVGIDLSLGDVAEPIVVYAVDRTTEPDPAEGGDGDEVVVTAFHLGSSTRLDDFLREAFQRISVRLVSSTVDSKQLWSPITSRPPPSPTSQPSPAEPVEVATIVVMSGPTTRMRIGG